MTSVANTVAMTTFAVHTLQPLIFYKLIDLSQPYISPGPPCGPKQSSSCKQRAVEASTTRAPRDRNDPPIGFECHLPAEIHP